jgi:hypothetical protein
MGEGGGCSYSGMLILLLLFKKLPLGSTSSVTYKNYFDYTV